MADRRYRVLAVCAHPVQYMSPILRLMAQHPQLDLKVAYCSLRGATAGHDPEFNATVQWDVPLLDGYDWIEIPNRGSGSESFFGLYNPGLWKLIREGKFDAVLCYTGYLRASFWIAFAAARSSGSAMIFGTDASSLAPRDARGWKVSIKKIVWPRLFGMADQIIVCSKAGVEMMCSLGLSDERITLTPFVVDNDWWSAQSAGIDRLAVRATWGVTPHQAVVLFCAKLQPWKRPLDLLRAFAKADVADSVLIFAGEGPLRSQLESEAQRLEITSRVRFLGFTNQSQLPAVYSASDLFALPSDYDPCPVVVCEAMLCGLPVLLSDEIRGRFDLVRPGVTGEIFRCGDVDALANAIRLLLYDRQLLAALGKNARVRMETWTPEDNISATVDAISIALQRRRGRDPRASGQVPGSAISPSAGNAKT
jgi:glycosyltransferase involved in cell wall biosynthesis